MSGQTYYKKKKRIQNFHKTAIEIPSDFKFFFYKTIAVSENENITRKNIA